MIETATTPAQAEDARPYPRVACHGASTIQIGTLTLSGEFDEIVAGLGAVQAAINENRLVAESRNEVLGNPYASLPAILRALTPHLKAAGITLLQPWESHGDIVRVTTVFLKGKQFAAMSASIRADNSLPQAIGSATTYCCRYSVRAMLGLAVDGPDDQDDDGNLASGVTARGASSKPRADATSDRKGEQPTGYSEKLRGYLKRVATADLAGLTSAEAQVPAFGLAETEEKVLLDAIRERKQALGADGSGVAEGAGSPTPKVSAQADTTKTAAAGTQKGQAKQSSEPSAKLRGYLKRVATAGLAGLASAEAQVPAFGLAEEEEKALLDAILERKQTLAGPASDSV